MLRSNRGNALMTVVADECGNHDTLGGACSKESNTLRYGHHTKHQHACVENFLREGARHGLGKPDLVSNINWYMNVPVEEDGMLGIVDGLSRPGLTYAARRCRHPGAGLQLPADQQPMQRLRPVAGADGRHAPVSEAPGQVEVLAPGMMTTVQDWPGRVGLWRVGVPPSGPMDDLSFRLGNWALGNEQGTPGLECTLVGPRLRFDAEATVMVDGRRARRRPSTASRSPAGSRWRCRRARRSTSASSTARA